MFTNCLAACAHLTITVSEIARDIVENNGRKAGFFHTPLYLTPPLGGFASEYRHPVWYGKTGMVWLPDGEKIPKICLFILTWSTNVTDRQTDGQTPHADIGRAYASHRAAKTAQQSWLIHWPLMTGHIWYSEEAPWAGCGLAQFPPHYTKNLMWQPSHQLPVYQLHVFRRGTI